jgi:hypothetical protein
MNYEVNAFPVAESGGILDPIRIGVVATRSLQLLMIGKITLADIEEITGGGEFAHLGISGYNIRGNNQCGVKQDISTKVYRYGMRYRPLQVGAQPRGFIPNPSNYRGQPDHNDHYRWGYIDYPTPLSEQDIKAYELEFVGQRTRHSKETP